MKKLSLSFVAVLFFCKCSIAQNNKNISTNPLAPINDEFVTLINQWFPLGAPYSINSFLNTGFNWYYPNQPAIDVGQNWIHPITNASTNQYYMSNPFGNGQPGALQYVSNEDNFYKGDFLWEDGWELLWMNLGQYPNGDLIKSPSQGTYADVYNLNYEPTPPQVPYFALYNRYTGLLRVFANIWYDLSTTTWDDVSVELYFDDETNVTGMLRSINGYDVGLDEETLILSSRSPRYGSSTLNPDEWAVAEFQLAFDPCVCVSRAKMTLKFEAIEEFEVELFSRSISLDVPLNQINNDFKDFLTVPLISSGEYVPGNVLYRQMDRMLEDYNNKLETYHRALADYKSYENSIWRKIFVLAKDVVTGSLTGTIPYHDIAYFLTKLGGRTISDAVSKETVLDYSELSSYKKFTISPWAGGDSIFYHNLESESLALTVSYDSTDQKVTIREFEYKDIESSLNKAVKSGLGEGYDFLSVQIFGEKLKKPTKPQVPVATFSEMVSEGTISAEQPRYSKSLYIPGSVNFPPVSSNSFQTFDPHPTQFPAYNQPLGLFAMMESPKLYREDFDLTSSDFDFDFRATMGPDDVYRVKHDFTYRLKLGLLDGINYFLNPAVDFDMENTNLTYSIVVETENYFVLPAQEGSPEKVDINANQWVREAWESLGVDVISTHDNVQLLHSYGITNPAVPNKPAPTITRNIYATDWSDVSEMESDIYELEISQSSRYLAVYSSYYRSNGVDPTPTSELRTRIASVKLKVMADMYFDQIGSEGEQVNTTQVFTYLLYVDTLGLDKTLSIDDYSDPTAFNKYPIGSFEMPAGVISPWHPIVDDNVGLVSSINRENVIVNESLKSLATNYVVSINAAKMIDIQPGADIQASVDLNIHDFYPNSQVVENMSFTDVLSRCQDPNKYRANQVNSKYTRNPEQDFREEELDVSNFRIHPNPAYQSFTINHDNSINSLVILDMSGVILLSHTYQNTMNPSVQIGELNPGTYIVQITDESGSTMRDKLVVQ